MAPPPASRWSVLSVAAVVIVLLHQFSSSSAIYCEEDDCYDLLGVTQNANASEIKKSYYKLSLKHHPDKNPDPESRKLFPKIANAYEILKDNASREQYDYAIAHPEEFFYNTARYYQAYYGYKTDPTSVLVGLLLVLSAFQYLNQWTRLPLVTTLVVKWPRHILYSGIIPKLKDILLEHARAIDMVKKTPAYKNKLRALELERNGGITNRKKGYKQMDKKTEEEFSKELELQINGADKPSIWGTLAVRFVLLPYTIGKLLLWHGCWFWRYQVKRAPYTWDDACYLTRRSLGAGVDAWRNIDELTKEDLVQRRLGEKSNLESYLTEMRKESKRRR